MNNILIYAFSALLCSFLAHQATLYIAYKKNILDVPNGTLKPHKIAIPKLGGVGLFVGLLISFLLVEDLKFQLFHIPIFCMFLIGLYDDIMDISPLFRLVTQLLSGAFLGFLYSGELFSTIIISVCFSFFVNAINMFDGLNSLLSTQTLLSWLSISYFTETPIVITLALFSLFAFYGFNRPQKASLFMGDAGSYTIASLSFTFILFSQTSLAPHDPTIIYALSLFFLIPILDALQVISRRVIEKRSPFSGDRYHSYDLLKLRGWKLGSTLLLLCSIQALIFIIVFKLELI
jgi:UDP-GlcNAc:undecaprenyl-phosphate/decaprenyl-phosphate GlcNAc-1-phosphate transferase